MPWELFDISAHPILAPIPVLAPSVKLKYEINARALLRTNTVPTYGLCKCGDTYVHKFYFDSERIMACARNF